MSLKSSKPKQSEHPHHQGQSKSNLEFVNGMRQAKSLLTDAFGSLAKSFRGLEAQLKDYERFDAEVSEAFNANEGQDLVGSISNFLRQVMDEFVRIATGGVMVAQKIRSVMDTYERLQKNINDIADDSYMHKSSNRPEAIEQQPIHMLKVHIDELGKELSELSHQAANLEPEQTLRFLESQHQIHEAVDKLKNILLQQSVIIGKGRDLLHDTTRALQFEDMLSQLLTNLLQRYQSQSANSDLPDQQNSAQKLSSTAALDYSSPVTQQDLKAGDIDLF